ncbi:MAG TPA: MFS transporter [Syntrophorhabdaceae bacterium]|jgi:FSR family fosmidomycin resistance protein-like MFS transporter|nr:MFS transporter [Syntrophorhabdaceae bacterium]MDI9560424.1 MFS transporter [Pseudomonadota bacterium]OQC47685.1 MAG: Fosmidomycin resistance protein [Deltaproteobacteria bacterium ADurb.Bin026]MBV6506669.1 Fosmidomycin resistance protein [Syntrophorhabdaceae bacterium]HNQ62884.1 MFS transporter [Syntrophorhabdaceae bacterium]
MAKQFSLKVLLILSLGHLVIDIYQGALPATLPFLKEKLSLSYTMTGFILMMANFTSSVLQPLFGFYSDKKTKAVLLPIGLLSAGIGFSLLSISSNYIVVLFLVVISGLGIAAYHPEGYKTAHFFTGDKSVTGMSIFSVGGNLGFSLGPLFAIYIIKYLGFSSLPVIVVPSLLCTAIILSYKTTIAIPRAAHAENQKDVSKTSLGAYVSLFVVIMIVVMRSWTQMGLLTYIPFYYINHLKGDPLFAGNLVFVYLACGAAGTLIGAPFADKWGHKRFLRLSMFLATITLPMIFIPFVQKTYLIFFVLGLQGMLLISTFSVTIVMAQKLLPNKLGVASGLMTGFAIGTGGIGVTLLGLVADNFGVPVALESIMILPLVGFILSLIVKYKG